MLQSVLRLVRTGMTMIRVVDRLQVQRKLLMQLLNGRCKHGHERASAHFSHYETTCISSFWGYLQPSTCPDPGHSPAEQSQHRLKQLPQITNVARSLSLKTSQHPWTVCSNSRPSSKRTHSRKLYAQAGGMRKHAQDLKRRTLVSSRISAV